MGESCGPAWVEAGSGPLPEEFDVVVRFLPEHASLSCLDNLSPLTPALSLKGRGSSCRSTRQPQ